MPMQVTYQTAIVTDRRTKAPVKIFYREAGDKDAPAILLLHGFPSSSHQYRRLIDKLSDKYRVVAPDLPGFGFSESPDPKVFEYTFDHLAEVMEGFTNIVGLSSYALYVFDYGAPVGFRLARSKPSRIRALISQNGNAYEEGLSDGWNPIRSYWQNPSEDNRNALRAFLKVETTQFQYFHGEADGTRIAPEGYTLDQQLLDRPGIDEIQLDLFADYKANITAYPAFHEYLREHKPPTLAVWGKNDPFFLPAGAEAFRRDIPDAEIHFVDAGHFALEAHLDEVAAIIRRFLAKNLDTAQGAALFGDPKTDAKTASSGALLSQLNAIFGFIPNLGYAMATEPPALDAYLKMLQALGETTLDPIAQQVALASASRANAAEYGVAIHATVAQKLGASEDVVTALRTGEALKDVKLEAVRRFAAAIVSKHTQVSDSDVVALKAAGFDHAAAVAIALAAAAKTLVNTVAHLSKSAIDPAFLTVQM